MEPLALVGGVVILIALGCMIVLGWGGTLVLFLSKRTRTLALSVSLTGAVIALLCASLQGLNDLASSGRNWAQFAENSVKMLTCGFGVGSACGIMVGLPLFFLFSFASRKPAADPPPASTPS